MSEQVEPVQRWDAPELGVRTFRVVILFFERTCGRAKLEEVWARERLPLPLSYVENLSAFVSLAFVERMFDVLLEASGDPEFVLKNEDRMLMSFLPCRLRWQLLPGLSVLRVPHIAPVL